MARVATADTSDMSATSAVVSDPATFTLRDYQREAVDKVAEAEHRGVRSQLGVAATGLGKTCIVAAVARERGCRTLVLAHRDELVSQAAAKIAEVWPGVSVGIVKASRDDIDAHVVVASVQTLANGARIERLLGSASRVSLLRPTAEPFGLVIVDEAHHAAAATYRTILDRVGCGRPDGPLLLGVTATPDRGDGKGLSDLFDEITWSYDILWGIRSGFLSDVRGMRVTVSGLDVAQIKVSKGDFDAGSAGRALEAADAAVHIARAWDQFARGRRCLLFAPTVATAFECAEALRDVGARSATVTGSTPTEERREILARYAHGEYDVLTNCAVLTEGFDDPRTDCIIVARPTKSRALYAQAVGRGTRRHPDKVDCLVLDVVGASDDHSLMTVPSLFGLEKKFRARMGDGSSYASDAIDDQEVALVAAGVLTATQADMFRRLRADGIAWVAVNGRDAALHVYQRSLGSDLPTVVLGQQSPGVDRYNVGLLLPRAEGGGRRYLMRDVSLESAQAIGEDFIRKVTGGRLSLADANAPWRKRRPSPKQEALAVRLGIDVGSAMTAGDVSDLIDARLARKRR